MDALIDFLTDPANWQGETGIPNRLVEHLFLAALAIAIASAIALPAGAYIGHTRRLDEVAARRQGGRQAEVIPFSGPLRELEQEPTAREIEVLQLISDGLVNREIGQRLFLSEETVKSHVRHLLAKLQARSRAHAVAVGFRRGLIA